jgi:two-component system, chemotaxis family, response regulator PixH
MSTGCTTIEFADRELRCGLPDVLCTPINTADVVAASVADVQEECEQEMAAPLFHPGLPSAQRLLESLLTEVCPAASSSQEKPTLPLDAIREVLDSATRPPIHPAEWKFKERRRRHRSIISAPVLIRTLTETQEISTTLDVSRSGLFFSTQHRSYRPGMEVAVVFPYSGNSDAPHAEQFGRIVRVVEITADQLGVAVSFGKPHPDQEIPLASVAEKVEHSETPPIEHPAETIRRPFVVAVESDPSARNVMLGFLTNEGYDANVVASSEDVHEIVTRRMPTLVIIEADGHGFSGYDLCAFIKSHPKTRRVPVLMLTRSAYPRDYASAHAVGATVCMAKPYKQERFGHVVRLLSPPAKAAAHTNEKNSPPRTTRKQQTSTLELNSVTPGRKFSISRLLVRVFKGPR